MALQIDRYVYGHPSGRRFDSAVKCWPHIRWLSFEHKSGPCRCVLCNNNDRIPNSEIMARPRKQPTKFSAANSTAASTANSTIDSAEDISEEDPKVGASRTGRRLRKRVSRKVEDLEVVEPDDGGEQS